MSNARSRSIYFKDGVVVAREPHHGISLVGSGDPIIHMWIMDRCVISIYTAARRVVSLCVFSLSFEFPFYISSANLGG